MTEPVMAISSAKNNAELMVQCQQLGYLSDEMKILDPTYEHGRFWQQWRPARLVTSDLNPDVPADRVDDFTRLSWPDGHFDAVVFDPPYKLNGTSAHPSDARYGVGGAYASVDQRHQLIRDGITDCARVLRRGGVLLIKCMDQVNGGRVRWQTHQFALHASQHGCELEDMMHLLSYRPQPAGRTQQHARRNYSTLLVCRKL